MAMDSYLLEGALKIANLILSGIAALIALTLIKSTKKSDLKPWILLIIALALFAVQQLLGELRAFKIYESPFLTHLNVTAILIVVLWALVIQHRQITRK